MICVAVMNIETYLLPSPFREPGPSKTLRRPSSLFGLSVCLLFPFFFFFFFFVFLSVSFSSRHAHSARCLRIPEAEE